MSKTLLIAGRELGAYRRSWLGPIVIAGTLLLDGFFFYNFGLTKPMLSAEALGVFFFWAGGIGAVAAVFLSMRLVAEERQTGTITLLNTAPVGEWEIVLGKFLALLAIVTLMTALTLYIPLWLMVRGKISLGHILVGYIGMILYAAAVASIGLFASTLTRSQIVAGVVGGLIAVGLVLVFHLGLVVDPPLNQFLSALALHHYNFRPFMDGVLELDSIVYYLSVIFVFLLAATKSMEARRWR